jgi:molybdopterin-guanine dinucleotide biosynthesis protein MobB
MKIPVFSFVAYSGTGKTTLLEKLIPELISRGIRVAIIKHDAHKFDIDKEGKDSWRFTQAGAAVTAIVSGEKAAIMENRPVSFESVIARISDVDIILTEGYKTGPYPKIALRRAGGEFPFAPSECFAVVSDDDSDANRGAPWFCLDDVSGIADLLQAAILRD